MHDPCQSRFTVNPESCANPNLPTFAVYSILPATFTRAPGTSCRSFRSGNAITVVLIVATRDSTPFSTANARPSQNVIDLPGLTTRPAGDQLLPRRRPQQIHFEFNRQHRRVRRHQAERRVPAGTVEQRRDDPRVHEPVLLPPLRLHRHFQIDLARRQMHHRRPNGGHHPLPPEAGPDARLIVGIERRERHGAMLCTLPLRDR